MPAVRQKGAAFDFLRGAGITGGDRNAYATLFTVMPGRYMFVPCDCEAEFALLMKYC